MQEVIKDSPSPSHATIGPECLGEVNSECAAKVALSFLANNSSECSPEGALMTASIAESEAQLIANIVDQGTISLSPLEFGSLVFHAIFKSKIYLQTRHSFFARTS